MTDIIVAGILIVILGIAIAYILKEKKKGVKCIGCPFAETCSSRNRSSSSDSCECHSEK